MSLDKHYTLRGLLVHALPVMAMMAFASVYGIVDGLCISNFAGKTAFAAVNLIMPYIMALASIGFMMGSGGGAIVANSYGQGKVEEARQHFSLFVLFTFVAGVAFAILGALTMEPVARALGADEQMLSIAVLYGRINMISLPFFMLQYAFQTFFSTAGLPRVGFAVTVLAGVTNIVLDLVFVGAMGLGVAGAAAATVTAELVGGVSSVAYFARPNESYLSLVHPTRSLAVLGRACANGSSEMVANIAMSVVSMVYNWRLMLTLGQDGVAAYGTIMYVSTLFAAIFQGFCVGSSPMMSYQQGAGNTAEMRSLLKNGLMSVGVLGLSMFGISQLLARPMASLFTSYDPELFSLTVHAFRLYSFAYIFMGFSFYSSALFTSLGNGVVSALISSLRTFVFEIGSVILLPTLLGADGIWLAVVVAEVACTILGSGMLLRLGPGYGLIGSPEAPLEGEKNRNSESMPLIGEGE